MKFFQVILKMLILNLINLIILTCSSSSNPASSSNTDTYYLEDFNRPLGTGSYEVVNGTSFYKKLNNGWLVYAEDFYHNESMDTLFGWYYIQDTVNHESYMQGITSQSGQGNLWLYKYYKVNKNDSLYISVNGRTSKNHNGTTTGPSMYIYAGKINYPSQDAEELIDWTISRWDNYELSPWLNLNMEIKSNESFITVALKVHDGWNSYQKFNDYDNLVILSK
jgi:hypothetical protein